MTDLLVEVLNQNWVRQAVTGAAKRCTITDELGQVGSAMIEISIDDPIVNSLPNPDANNPYEGRFKVYEDDSLKFAGVIDSRTIQFNESEGTVSFEGKHRGILLGYYNLGRRDFLGWGLPEFFREMLRDNIAKNATIESVTNEDLIYQSVLAISGDPFKANYWKSTWPSELVIDLGEEKPISAIRVQPQWWKDIDTKRFHYTDFVVSTSSSPDSMFTVRGTKATQRPSNEKGHLYETPGVTCRYVKLATTGASDDFARIGQLMVYQDIASIGGETTYITPFVENNDSGNCTTTGTTSQPIIAGAFQGDGVIGHSAVTRLDSGTASITHTFRGTSNAVFFTQANKGAAVAKIYLDGVDQGNVSIASDTYWFNGYEVGGLADTVHTLKVERVSGTPQVDYFNGLYRSSWRPIEDDDPSLAYLGTWEAVEAPEYFNYFSAKASVDDRLKFNFLGNHVRIMGSKTADGGTFQVLIDGASQGTFSNTGAAHKQVLYENSGLTYADHYIEIVVLTGKFYLDRIEGNFAHTLYIRSRYEPNLKVLERMSEILDSYLRFNDDGSVDLLGSVGVWGGTTIREGENEGGTIIQASAEHNYTETGSAVLALVNVNGELPIKAMVIDYEAVQEIGYKLIKLENADAADQFLLNRQALQYLRDHRKPDTNYSINFDDSEVGEVVVGENTRLYSPKLKLDGDEFRVGKVTTEYLGG